MAEQDEAKQPERFVLVSEKLLHEVIELLGIHDPGIGSGERYAKEELQEVMKEIDLTHPMLRAAELALTKMNAMQSQTLMALIKCKEHLATAMFAVHRLESGNSWLPSMRKGLEEAKEYIELAECGGIKQDSK